MPPPPAIRPLHDGDRPAWIGLRQALWMGSDATTKAAEDGTLLSDPQRFGALRYAVLLAFEDERAVGFIEISLRDDLAERAGKNVGYVEGVYVAPTSQRRGLARSLIEAAAAWTREQGAAELTSDVQPDNGPGLDFHRRVGFAMIGETGDGDRRQVLLARPVRQA